MLKRFARKPAIAALAATAALATLFAGAASPGAAFGASVRASASDDACRAPATDAEPGTEAWTAREVQNLECMSQGSEDAQANPVYVAAFEEMSAAWAKEEGRGERVRGDPLRYPPSHWNGTRGRYQQVWISTVGGGRFTAELFAPLGLRRGPSPRVPIGLRRNGPPYPVVVLEHGGLATKEMFWQIAEVVAEAGYLVLNIDVFNADTGAVYPADPPPAEPAFLFAARNGLDFALATPSQPTATGQVNPWWQLADRSRVALLGSSLGAISVGHLGQVDERVDAVVAYDSCEYVLDALGNVGPDPASISPGGGGCRSRPATVSPDQMRTPRLAISADYHRASDTPRSMPPDPHYKDEYTRSLVGSGVDAMQVSIRASSHADVADDEPGKISNSRYGQAVANYFTLAWLDYHLKGEGRPEVRWRACERLIGPTFDRFADAHEIGTGRFDPALVNPQDTESGNVPASVGGLPVRDRLSYLFASTLFLDGGAVRSDDLRAPMSRSACSRVSGPRRQLRQGPAKRHDPNAHGASVP